MVSNANASIKHPSLSCCVNSPHIYLKILISFTISIPQHSQQGRKVPGAVGSSGLVSLAFCGNKQTIVTTR